MRPQIKEAYKETDILGRIGNTPLIHLKRIGRNCPSVEIYGKAEWFNPGGSVKDRPAVEMIEQGEQAGSLRAALTRSWPVQLGGPETVVKLAGESELPLWRRR